MQILVLFVVIAVLGVNCHHLGKEQIHAVSKREVRSSTDDALKNVLDTTVRDMILHGSADWGLPVLDPLDIPHLDINLDFDPIKLTGSADGLEITGISTFVVDDVKLNILGLSVEFAIHVPKLVVTADHYDIDGVLGDLIPVYGDGHLEAEVDGLYLSGKIQIGTNNTFIILKSVDLDFSIEALQTNIEGLLGGGDVSDLMNEVIDDVAPQLLQDAKASLLPILSDEVIKLANEKLIGVTVTDLLGLLTG